jgi:hypothetical protein
MQYVASKVVPVLAGVVAYLDTNHNLDLLQATPLWIQKVGPCCWPTNNHAWFIN